MMVMSRLVVPLIAALVVCASAGFAVTFTTYEWSVEEWQCSNNPYGKPIPTLCKNLDWGETWEVGGKHQWRLIGAAPPEIDPAVSQNVRNRNPQVQWTDWHVQITNGTWVEGSAIVYNRNAPSPQWEINAIPGGFFAHVVSGMDTQVDYNEVLYIYFEYLVNDPQLPVSINQYPTTDWPIPEPSSILAVLAGCLAFAFRVRRRA